jgi:oxaloacetate decarboxylase alpha subunit
MDRLTEELKGIAAEKGVELSDRLAEDVLIYAQFPQVGLKFLENRNNPAAFEPVPTGEPEAAPAAMLAAGGPEAYSITVDGRAYAVTVAPGGEVVSAVPVAAAPAAAPVAATGGQAVPAPLAGNIFKVLVAPGQVVKAGDVIMVLEAMKMETEVRSPADGAVATVAVKEGDAVQVGDTLMTLS